jgi:hypothetical protein
VFGGERIDAEEAYRRGLVMAWARKDEALDALVHAWITAHLLPRAAASLRRANRASRVAFHVRLERELGLLDRLTGFSLGATAPGVVPVLPGDFYAQASRPAGSVRPR